jgi:hypothetical protein
MDTNINISKVSAARMSAVERDIGTINTAVDLAILAVDGMDFAVAAEVRCGSSGQATCDM